MVSVVTAAPGRPALERLRDAIAEAKGGDALAPVTVAVPSNRAGLSIRRALAGGAVGPLVPGGRPGLVNVGFVVLDRVAELLGSPHLAAEGRAPITAALAAEALRGELVARPGVFAPVAAHPASERALLRAFAELRPCDDDTLGRLAATGERAADLVALYRGWRRRLAAGWYDEHDLAAAATSAVREGTPAMADLGPVVVHLPRRLSTGQRQMVDAIGATVIEPDLGRGMPAASAVVTTDPDEEVRAVVRLVLEQLQRGTPLYRIGIFHPGTDGYGQLILQHLAGASVPAHGPSGRTLGQSVAGRTLLELLALPDRGWRRDDVIGWLSTAPVVDRQRRRPVPAARWDSLSRLAGVVAGADQWADRLAALEHVIAAEQDAADPDEDEWRHRRRADDLVQVRELRLFVAELVAEVEAGAPRTPARWGVLAGWASELLHRSVGDGGLGRWPEVEREALEAVDAAVSGLAALDALGLPADLTAFRRGVERALDVPDRALGRFGHGVLVAPLAVGAGLDLDAVFVVGLAEGILPSRDREDPLLTDRERRAAAGELDVRRVRTEEERRDLVLALDAATTTKVVTFARSDLRQGRDRIPSRWLLEAVGQTTGERVFSEDLLPLAAAGGPVTFVKSHEHGLLSSAEPESLHDRDLADLVRWTISGGRPERHVLARSLPTLGRGLVCDQARRSSQFTEYDGRVPAGAVGMADTGQPVSATSLEMYARCPRQHLLSRVLRVAAADKPEEILRLSPIDRGTLTHAILERYVAGLVEGRPRSVDDLLAVADELGAEFEARGLTGKPLWWRYDREVLRRDLLGFYRHDTGRPLAVELTFGADVDTPVTINLGSRSIAFKGTIDRVDEGPSGLVVTDYKTGSAASYEGLDDTKVDRGRKLQLPLYALAAQARFGTRPVTSRYWFVTQRARFKSIGYDIDDNVLHRFHEAVEVAVGGITSGSFPARPGGVDSRGGWENCRYCDYDALCPSDRARQWERKRSAPELAAYVALAEGEHQ